LHIGVTVSGNGCKLADRIRRELGAVLPPRIGSAIERLGALRRRLQAEDARRSQEHRSNGEADDDDDDDAAAAHKRRMHYLSQICEFWPLSRLAAFSDDEIIKLLASYTGTEPIEGLPPTASTRVAAAVDAVHRSKQQKEGSITLAGAGPGSAALLTLGTLLAMRGADVILADKLVPAAILRMAPHHARVDIAGKFPGRAQAAQTELLQTALLAAQQGKCVLRLKAGDPSVFGRVAEEAAWFAEHGFPPRILPGLSSALIAPLAARVFITSRGVADHFTVCSGTAAGGVMPPLLPGCHPGRTVVLLMGLHRLDQVVARLTGADSVDGADSPGGGEGASGAATAAAAAATTAAGHNGLDGPAWPAATACAVVERASCNDQRVIRSKLQHVCAAVEEIGSRPPGLLVMGAACEASLENMGTMWEVEEGYDEFDNVMRLAIREDLIMDESV
jgi:uroporphyrin-III C-methyltransferase